MGQHKEGLEVAAGAWKTAADIKGYRCIRCGEIPPYEEREVYFESKMCAWCRHMSEKDD
jgi:hypothetical protein